MKYLIILVFIGFVNLNAVVCTEDSSGWTSKAFDAIKPYEIFDDGMTDLLDAMQDISVFAITELYMVMSAEKIAAIDFARVNAVSSALDYELSALEDNLYNTSKISSEVMGLRLEVSELLNEIQLGIISIKTNKIISDEKKLLY
jgi:hypothetical protein